MEPTVPKPILFNCWKHHQGFLIDFIRSTSLKKDLPEIRHYLKKIGGSTTDLYTGHLSLPEIYNICKRQINERGISGEKPYVDWIASSAEDYRTLSFPDSSVWVYKIGIEKGRYVHIHPGRNVPHTLRIKANVLKTAIVSNILALSEHLNPLDINIINRSRTQYINLEPIKFVTMNHELGQVIYNFARKLEILS